MAQLAQQLKVVGVVCFDVLAGGWEQTALVLAAAVFLLLFAGRKAEVRRRATEFFFPLKHNESVIFIEDGKVYIEAWIEEGWDDENNCATDDYKYYDKIIVKDFAGNKISEEVGCLNKGPDGNWWIS